MILAVILILLAAAIAFAGWQIWQKRKFPDEIGGFRRNGKLPDASAKKIWLSERLIYTGARKLQEITPSPKGPGGLMLCTAAAYTIDFLSEDRDREALHEGLKRIGVSVERLRRTMRPVPGDPPEGTAGVTVQDRDGLYCYFAGAPDDLIRRCRYILDGGIRRRIEPADQARIMDQAAQIDTNHDIWIGYGLLTGAEKRLQRTVFLGTVLLTDEVRPGLRGQWESLTDGWTVSEQPENAVCFGTAQEEPAGLHFITETPETARWDLVAGELDHRKS